MEASLLRQLISTGPAELLIASIWQGLLLTTMAWAALKLAPGLRASTRFTLWLIVFLLVALLPGFAIVRGSFGAPSSPASSMSTTAFALHLNPAWAFAIEGFWVLTSLFSLARLLASGQQMRNLYRNSTPIAFEDLTGEVQSAVARGGARSVELRLSDAIDAPSVIGFFHPAIVVPRSLWNELAPVELKQVVLHEIAHLDRGDDWTNLLQKLLRALSPLNPALFWAERHLCMERERACDDQVLDAEGNARAYATCLTRLAETRLVQRAASLAPGLWKRRSELADRVENILHRRRNLGPLFSRGLVAAGLFASLSAGLVLQRCPGMITFADASNTISSNHVASPQHQAGLYQPARYQEAVFHPTRGSRPIESTPDPPKPHGTRNVHAPGRVRFLELRSAEDDGGEGVTLIIFTVEVPQATTLSTTDNWIAFQI
jgi:beta-lactamase regulating signal transducer with metallopeptidase domain